MSNPVKTFITGNLVLVFLAFLIGVILDLTVGQLMELIQFGLLGLIIIFIFQLKDSLKEEIKT